MELAMETGTGVTGSMSTVNVWIAKQHTSSRVTLSYLKRLTGLVWSARMRVSNLSLIFLLKK